MAQSLREFGRSLIWWDVSELAVGTTRASFTKGYERIRRFQSDMASLWWHCVSGVSDYFWLVPPSFGELFRWQDPVALRKWIITYTAAEWNDSLLPQWPITNTFLSQHVMLELHAWHQQPGWDHRSHWCPLLAGEKDSDMQDDCRSKHIMVLDHNRWRCIPVDVYLLTMIRMYDQ